MYYISMLIVIAANILYHISQKSISKTLNPMVSMIVTYSTALIITVIFLLIFPMGKSSISSELKSINWASYLLGLAAVGLEVGFLLVYRSGWNISFAAIFSNVVVTILLIPVGIYFFKDKITYTNALGVIVSILGIYLITKK